MKIISSQKCLLDINFIFFEMEISIIILHIYINKLYAN